MTLAVSQNVRKNRHINYARHYSLCHHLKLDEGFGEVLDREPFS
jgi:hypothetical protein